MNLEKLNLVELNAQEIQETEGGFFLLLQNPLVIAFAVGMYNQYQSHNH
ncbi:class IIb bacteriocin, lactobin A/cerein 7B family [Flavobacterium collinsii]|nr:class IIb bacteriocin, lactobin A/cerein 7B family [Flavobacterium collinsii]